MALKRINNDLTDLGRYVITLFPHPSGRMFTRMTGMMRGARPWVLQNLAEPFVPRTFADDVFVVTHPHHALQALSEMI
jgi:hypothetical protein